MRPRFWTMAAVGGLVFAAGCEQPKVTTVHGRVRFPDGTPLTLGRVIFECPKPRSKGDAPLGPDGSFEVAGLTPGTYGVFVLGAVPDAPYPAAGPTVSMIDEKYGDPATSGWTFTVGDPGEAEFTVTRPAKR